MTFDWTSMCAEVGFPFLDATKKSAAQYSSVPFAWVSMTKGSSHWARASRRIHAVTGDPADCRRYSPEVAIRGGCTCSRPEIVDGHPRRRRRRERIDRLDRGLSVLVVDVPVVEAGVTVEVGAELRRGADSFCSRAARCRLRRPRLRSPAPASLGPPLLDEPPPSAGTATSHGIIELAPARSKASSR